MAWLGRTSKKEYCWGAGKKEKGIGSWADRIGLPRSHVSDLCLCPVCDKMLKRTKTGKVRRHRVG